METTAGHAKRLSAATRALADSIVDGVMVVDEHGRVVALNAGAEAVLGFTLEDLHGRRATDMIVAHASADGPDGLHAVDRMLTGLEVVRGETQWLTRKDGTRFAMAFTATPVLERDGTIGGGVIVFQDISARRDDEMLRDLVAGERDAITAALQQSLLPRQLPDIEGVELAVSFRPLGAQVLVGGDFYDVFPCADGHVVVVGDVCGKGPEAGALGGMVRFLIRGAAAADADLPRLVRKVNSELRDHPSDRFVTLVLAHVGRERDGRREVRIAVAGHAPPVILRGDGEAHAATAIGQLLGLFPDPTIGSCAFALVDGDALVFFTDGLTDIRVREGAPEIDVAAILTGQQGRSADELVTVLEDASGVFDNLVSLPDDVAVLVLRLTDDEAPAPTATPVGAAPASGDLKAEFRDLNEAVEAGRPDDAGALGLICECGHPECREVITVPRADYERIRGDERCFAIVPGHQIVRSETVVEKRDAYWIVRSTS